MYKALGENGNPSFATISRVARAVGVKFHAEAAGVEVEQVIPSGRLRRRLNGSVIPHGSPLFNPSLPEQGVAMAVFLDHMIVPAKNRRRSAEILAKLLGVRWSETGTGPFCPVYVNDGLTLDFDQWDEALPVQHYCFRMSEAEFDRLVARLGEMGIGYRSTPHGPPDAQVNTRYGGRIVYWSEPDGHVWEALTVSYARETEPKCGAVDSSEGDSQGI